MSSERGFYRIRSDGLVLHVRLTSKGGRDAVDGPATLSDGSKVLKVRVRAVPEEGAANAGLIAVLAKFLDVPRSQIRLEAGATARIKTLLVGGDIEKIRHRLDGLTEEGAVA